MNQKDEAKLKRNHEANVKRNRSESAEANEPPSRPEPVRLVETPKILIYRQHQTGAGECARARKKTRPINMTTTTP